MIKQEIYQKYFKAMRQRMCQSKGNKYSIVSSSEERTLGMKKLKIV